MAKPIKTWGGIVPKICDMCTDPIVDIFIDGRLRSHGQWAVLCPECNKLHGSGLGVGRGQQYELQPDKKTWKKTAG